MEETVFFKAVPVVPTMEGRGALEVTLELDAVLVFERAPGVKTEPITFPFATLLVATKPGIMDCRRAAIASDARLFAGAERVAVDTTLMRGLAVRRDGGGGAIDPRGAMDVRGAIDILGATVAFPAVRVLAIDGRGAVERREPSEGILAAGPFEAIENLGSRFPADDLLGLAEMRLRLGEGDAAGVP
jgi:hypothetical protein